jgi:N-acetylmuramoyl-L-alanine amidase
MDGSIGDSTPSDGKAARMSWGQLGRTAGVTVLCVLVGSLFMAAGFFLGWGAVGWLAPTKVPSGNAAAPAPQASTAAQTATTTVVATASVDVVPGSIEVPKLVGMRVDQALVMLQSSGFNVAVTSETTGAVAAEKRFVLTQVPAAGTIAAADSTVTLSAPPLVGGARSAVSSAPVTPSAFVVCIDPGHQKQTSMTREALGPGSKTLMPTATGGNTGVVTGVPEYEIALEIAMDLKKRLEAAGVDVVLTRTKNNVNLSNIARAKIANKAHADLLVRIHCNASTSQNDAGLETVYPAKNQWTAKIVGKSKIAAAAVEAAALRSTRAQNRGVRSVTDVVGFNWAQMPAIMVEAGFLSNPVEDKLLASPAYQGRLSQGLSDGILSYLRSNAGR